MHHEWALAGRTARHTSVWCVCVCMYVCMYVCMCMYECQRCTTNGPSLAEQPNTLMCGVYVCIYIYTHKHTYTYTYRVHHPKLDVPAYDMHTGMFPRKMHIYTHKHTCIHKFAKPGHAYTSTRECVGACVHNSCTYLRMHVSSCVCVHVCVLIYITKAHTENLHTYIYDLNTGQYLLLRHMQLHIHIQKTYKHTYVHTRFSAGIFT
jgi:hypothetical protein